MSGGRILAAVLLGGLLATLPFFRYAGLAIGDFAAHSNHEARHGGQLAMIGDHHVELVRDGHEVEVYLSDAWRRPLRPRDARVVFDGAESVSLAWQSHRMVGADRPTSKAAEVALVLDDGTRLSLGFDRP